MSSFEFLTEAEATKGKSKVWDYGILVGYAWEEMFKTGVLQVTFLKETCEIPYNEDELQDLGLETYALRPLSCEMRSIHNSVHDHFNAADQPARRNSATILRKVGMSLVDEREVFYGVQRRWHTS
ncbi:hypothetical protein JG687_00002732 [Phytophthora cactorum]|uniref:Uncharacterized protein n=1 Tax=Phytophthora cactorum TaxID=29920 RepID=A0A8T1UWG5_9STRA|nr:hypothetical protein JG687_00002732 [Phytophthora cactorum]